MGWLEALVLGIVQGLTEFLPVSSSGHLEIASVLLGVQTSESLLFAVLLHAATALSTIVVFRSEILEILKGLFQFKWNEEWKFSIKILISMVPVGVIGILFEDEIASFFSGNLLLVGSALIFTSALLYFSHKKGFKDKNVSFLHAFVIGLAQAVAIMPGVSRSGATIATALILGVEKSKATRFSFLMVLIPILGAGALKLKDYLEGAETVSIAGSSLVIGFIAAFISGYLACVWMLNIVRKGKLSWFAAYCFLVGLVAILSQLF